MKDFTTISEVEKEFRKKYDEICKKCNQDRHTVWFELVNMFACAIANSCETYAHRYKEREKLYRLSNEKLGVKVEEVSELFALLVVAYSLDSNQDFLGKIYMTEELGNKHLQQFFTPYSLSQLMAEFTFNEEIAKKEIIENGYVIVNDCCIGAGSIGIAMANRLIKENINPQQIVVVGQDIDSNVAKMAYIQLALIGVTGYICIANTLTEPITGSILNPCGCEANNFWFLPNFWTVGPLKCSTT